MWYIEKQSLRSTSGGRNRKRGRLPSSNQRPDTTEDTKGELRTKWCVGPKECRGQQTVVKPRGKLGRWEGQRTGDEFQRPRIRGEGRGRQIKKPEDGPTRGTAEKHREQKGPKSRGLSESLRSNKSIVTTVTRANPKHRGESRAGHLESHTGGKSSRCTRVGQCSGGPLHTRKRKSKAGKYSPGCRIGAQLLGQWESPQERSRHPPGSRGGKDPIAGAWRGWPSMVN